MDTSNTWTFDAIGTKWQIDIPEASSKFEMLQRKISNCIEEFDKHYSRFRDDSLITRMSQEAGEYVLPDDAKPMFDLYERLYKATKGAFTPLIGKVLVDAGYDAQYSLEVKELSQPPTWDEALVYNFPKLRLLQPTVLDLGAIGKGYLVDHIADFIETEGFDTYIVDAGGDMRMRSTVPEKIGLEHPDNPQQVIGVVSLSEGALCGSAGNRRRWPNNGQTIHHIINPHSLRSVEEVKAVWVSASEARIADALTTCLYLVPTEELTSQLSDFSFEYLIINDDLSYRMSSQFPAEIFTKP